MSPSIGGDEIFVHDFQTGDTNLPQDAFVRDRVPGSPFCFGDGTNAACPCANVGGAGRGCQNSATTGGAILTATGNAMLSADTMQLSASYELPSAPSIVLQRSSIVGLGNLGDRLHCAGGTLWRLHVKSANGGVITAPEAGNLAISTRVAGFGHPIPLGATRIYQVYYRDPSLAFCPGAFSATNALAVAWGA